MVTSEKPAKRSDVTSSWERTYDTRALPTLPSSVADAGEHQLLERLHPRRLHPTHLTEVLLKVAQLQTVLQLSAVTLPEIVKRRLRLIQLPQEPGGREEHR